MKRNSLIPRIFIFIVLFFNLQCAVLFLATPDIYAPGFELTGIPGRMMVQGMGLLFLMWNVPYCLAVIQPFRNQKSLFEAVIMQGIGVIGETILFNQVSIEHILLRTSALRFILFDASGLLLLLAAAGMVLTQQKKISLN